MLARGELHCIGATTLDEYRKYIEKDAALERRFQPVMVAEPTVEDTISILRGLKERYEIFHGVRIHDNALVAAATLSDRYITDRFLPDKAIDLVDEACAMIRTEIDSMPSELDDIRRRIIPARDRGDGPSKRRTTASVRTASRSSRRSSPSRRTSSNAMKARWEAERDSVDAVKRNKGRDRAAQRRYRAGADEPRIREGREAQVFRPARARKSSSKRPRRPPRAAARRIRSCTTPSPRRR